MPAIGGPAKPGGGAKGKIGLGRIADRPAACAIRQNGERRRPIDGGWPLGGAADDKADALGGVYLPAVLPDGAKADAVAPQGGAQRLGVHAERARDVFCRERRQRGDDFCEFSSRPPPPALVIEGWNREGWIGGDAVVRGVREVLQHGCLVNAELFNWLWKNTVLSRDSTSRTAEYTKRVNRVLNFT